MFTTDGDPIPPGATLQDCALNATRAGIRATSISEHAGRVFLICETEPAKQALDAWRARMVADPAPADAPIRVQATLDAAIAQAMAALQQILDTADIPAGTLTTAQLSNAARTRQTEMKTVARLLRRLVRQVRGDLTGSD